MNRCKPLRVADALDLYWVILSPIRKGVVYHQGIAMLHSMIRRDYLSFLGGGKVQTILAHPGLVLTLGSRGFGHSVCVTHWIFRKMTEHIENARWLSFGWTFSYFWDHRRKGLTFFFLLGVAFCVNRRKWSFSSPHLGYELD